MPDQPVLDHFDLAHLGEHVRRSFDLDVVSDLPEELSALLQMLSGVETANQHSESP